MTKFNAIERSGVGNVVALNQGIAAVIGVDAVPSGLQPVAGYDVVPDKLWIVRLAGSGLCHENAVDRGVNDGVALDQGPIVTQIHNPASAPDHRTGRRGLIRPVSVEVET